MGKQNEVISACVWINWMECWIVMYDISLVCVMQLNQKSDSYEPLLIYHYFLRMLCLCFHLSAHP